MNIPTIHATNCPSPEKLSLDYGIVVVSQFPDAIGVTTIGYVGKVHGFTVDSPFDLEDPFHYLSRWQVVQTEPRDKPRMVRVRTIVPLDGFGLERAMVRAECIIRCSAMTPLEVETFRKDLIPAWDAVEHIRKQGNLVTVHGPNTSIRPVRP